MTQKNKIICQQCHKNTFFKLPNSPILADCCQRILCLTCFSHFDHLCQNKKSLLSQTSNIDLCSRCKGKIALYSCQSCSQKYYCKECLVQLHSKGKFQTHHYEKLPGNQNNPKQVKQKKLDKQNPQVLKFRGNVCASINNQKQIHGIPRDITNQSMKKQIEQLLININSNRSYIALSQIQVKQNWFRIEKQINQYFGKAQQLLSDRWKQTKSFIQQNRKNELQNIYESIRLVDAYRQQIHNVQGLMADYYITQYQSMSIQGVKFLKQKIRFLSQGIKSNSHIIRSKNCVSLDYNKKQITSLIQSLQKINSHKIVKISQMDHLKIQKMASSTVLSNRSRNNQKNCLKKNLNEMIKSTTSVKIQAQLQQEFQQRKKRKDGHLIALKKRKNSHGQIQKGFLSRIKSQKYLEANESMNSSLKFTFLQNLNQAQKQKHKQKSKEVFLRKSCIRHIKI